MKPPDRRKTESRVAAAPRENNNDSAGNSKDSGNAKGEQGVAVCCAKHDGTRYVFQHYATREEAEAVAKTLRSVGCEAEVHEAGSRAAS